MCANMACYTFNNAYMLQRFALNNSNFSIIIIVQPCYYIYIYKYKKQLQKIERKVGIEYQKAYKQG